MENGYHEILTVMQSIDLCDDIDILFNQSGIFSAQSNLCYLPKGEKNIAVRAARLFFETAGMTSQGCEIVINKRIPVCAGMAGGSTDGAAVLCALNDKFSVGMTQKELETLAESLGSDVPFCVSGGTKLCTGRGEIMTELKPLPSCWAVICKPPFPISTAELFSVVDSAPIKHRPDTDGILKAIEQGCLGGVAHRMYNVFEDVLPPRCSEITQIKAKLLDGGALGASMTGTGSAVFGLFSDGADAERAFNFLRMQYQECFLTKTLEKYV
jgi:4-diphosphocytidyl-2-C-methyl-D-erythritol kinase